jgi:hypothetical protein
MVGERGCACQKRRRPAAELRGSDVEAHVGMLAGWTLVLLALKDLSVATRYELCVAISALATAHDILAWCATYGKSSVSALTAVTSIYHESKMAPKAATFLASIPNTTCVVTF